jgi:hypothetical protein
MQDQGVVAALVVLGLPGLVPQAVTEATGQ